MTTTVSIPDDLFRQADALVRRCGKSQSQVYREALVEYLRRRDAHGVTSALDDLVDALDPGPDPWVERTGRHVLERSER